MNMGFKVLMQIHRCEWNSHTLSYLLDEGCKYDYGTYVVYIDHKLAVPVTRYQAKVKRRTVRSGISGGSRPENVNPKAWQRWALQPIILDNFS